MIFWIFVILVIMSVAAFIIVNRISDKYNYFEKEKNSKFVNFIYHNSSPFFYISMTTMIIGGVVAAIMLCTIIESHVMANGLRAKNEQKYNTLIYKTQTESIRDEFGIVNKSYIDEIQKWNEDLAEYQSYSNNFWIGIFYPKCVYDEFEFIDLQDIKIRN